MQVRAVQAIYDEPSLEISWKIFFETLGIQAADKVHSFNLPSGTYTPDLWLINEQIAVEIESYKQETKVFHKIGEQIPYQEAADQSDFPILCIKGLPQANRYSIRFFVPRNKAHIYPRFYWATFAEGDSQKLCLIEGNKYWYLKRNNSRNWPQSLALPLPSRNSELILQALACANSEMSIRTRECRLSYGFAE